MPLDSVHPSQASALPCSSTIASAESDRHRSSSSRSFDDSRPSGSLSGYSRIRANFALMTANAASRTCSADLETWAGPSTCSDGATESAGAAYQADSASSWTVQSVLRRTSPSGIASNPLHPNSANHAAGHAPRRDQRTSAASRVKSSAYTGVWHPASMVARRPFLVRGNSRRSAIRELGPRRIPRSHSRILRCGDSRSDLRPCEFDCDERLRVFRVFRPPAVVPHNAAHGHAMQPVTSPAPCLLSVTLCIVRV